MKKPRINLKRYLPTPEELRGYKSLRFMGEVLFKPNLWHFNNYSVSWGMLIGGFCGWLPILFQTIPALFLCILIRCNVPVTVAIVWISNPFTMPAMMVFAYQVGARMLGRDPALPVDDLRPETLWNNFFEIFAAVGWPLVLGAVVCGLVTGLLGFTAVRIYYRLRASGYLRHRRQRAPRRRGESGQA